MSVTALKCKECGQEYPLEAHYACEAMFRPARGGLRLLGARPRRDAPPDPGRAQHDLALRGLPPVQDAAADGAFGGRHAARARRPPGRAAGTRRALDQERRGQPDPLVQGPRGHDRRGQGRRARLRHDRLRLHRQPRQRGGRPRRGGGRGVVRLHPVRSRGAEDPRDRRLWHARSRRQRQLRRRQPPLHRALGRARLGVREHQLPPLLLPGLQDPRLRDRRAARIRDPRPDRCSDRLGLALHQDRPRPRGVARDRSDRGRAAHVQRRPGRGLLAGGAGLRRAAGTRASRSSRTRSPSRWRSGTPPMAPTRSTWRGAPAARSTRSTTTRSAPASRPWPRPRAFSPRRPAA